MIALFALLMLAQEINGPVPQGRLNDERPAPFPDIYEEMDRAVTPASRRALATFTRCVINRSGERAGELLRQDFTRSAFRTGLSRLASANEDCFRGTGERQMRVGGLPFAAELAEQLIERDPAPLNARLAKAAAGNAAPTYAPSDAVAMCLARSLPDEAAALLASEPASEAETAAAARLAPAVPLCARMVGVAGIEADAYGLRTIIASAAFRLLAAQEVAQ